MTAWGFRSRGYQIGVIMMCIFTGLFIIGLVAPAWLTYDKVVVRIRNVRWFAGVFVGCRYQLSLIGSKSFEYTRCGFGFEYAFRDMKEMGGWCHAVETFEMLSAVGMLFACIYSAIINCFSMFPSGRSRLIEIVAGLAGLVAFVFCMVFVGMLRAAVERDVFFFFTWGYYLSTISSIAIMVSAVIIGLFNEYIPPPVDRIHNQGGYNPNTSFSNMSAATAPKPPGFAYGAQPYGEHMQQWAAQSVRYNAHKDELDDRILQAGYDQDFGHNKPRHRDESDI